MIEPMIEISYDEVKIENCIVLRPSKFSAKQWIDFWEAIKDYDPNETAEKEEKALSEIQDLQWTIEELRNENMDLRERLAAAEGREQE